MTTDEKGVFIQKQNTIVSSKALVLGNFLNTFVHYCPSEKQLVYIVWYFSRQASDVCIKMLSQARP